MMFGQGAGGDLRYVDDVWAGAGGDLRYVDDVWAGGRGRLEVCR